MRCKCTLAPGQVLYPMVYLDRGSLSMLRVYSFAISGCGRPLLAPLMGRIMTATKSSKEKPFREKYSFFIVVGLMALIGLYALLSKEVFGLPLFTYLILLGADIIFVGVTWMKRAADAKHWPSVPARLISANAVERRSHKDGRKWYLEIEYEYTVSGESHLSRNYNWIGAASSNKAKINKLIQDMQSDGQLKATYNPHEFGESVIVTNVSPLYLVGMAVGLTVVCGGLAGILDYFELIDVGRYIS